MNKKNVNEVVRLTFADLGRFPLIHQKAGWFVNLSHATGLISKVVREEADGAVMY